MHRIKIRLPATVTDLGPGLRCLGLALNLYVTVEVTERRDDSFAVEMTGEGAAAFPVEIRHPAALALIRVFQKYERALLGINIRVDNRIPLNSGLGAEAAFTVAGVLAANNLLGNPSPREEMLRLAAQITGRTDSVMTTILGGATISAGEGDTLLARPLPITALKVAVVLPELPGYNRHPPPLEHVPLEDTLFNLSRLPLLIMALKEGDFSLLGQAMYDRIRTPALISRIRGYDQVVEQARQAGAAAVAISGDGPALVAFAPDKHDAIAESMSQAFQSQGVRARSWVLPVDTQGIVLSVMQSV